jgi:hypothetical protein
MVGSLDLPGRTNIVRVRLLNSPHIITMLTLSVTPLLLTEASYSLVKGKMPLGSEAFIPFKTDNVQ